MTQRVVQGIGLDGLGQAEDERILTLPALVTIAWCSQQDDWQAGPGGAKLSHQIKRGDSGEILVDNGGCQRTRTHQAQGFGLVGRDERLQLPGLEAIRQHGAVDGVIIHREHRATTGDRRKNRRAEIREADRGGLDVEAEARTLAGSARHIDASAHELAEPVADGETQAGAAIFARGGGINLGEGLEQHAMTLRRDADAGVSDLEIQQNLGVGGRGDVARHPDLDGDGAALGELDGIVHQIDQHLAQTGAVAEDAARHGGIDEVGQLDVLGGGLQGKNIDGLLDAMDEFKGLVFQFHLAGLDFGEIENFIDDGKQRITTRPDGADIVALFGVQLGFEQEAGHADDPVHRGADLVRHRRQKIGLGARSGIGLGLGAAQLLLGLDAGGDVGLDGDEVFRQALVVDDGLHVEVHVKAPPGLGLLHHIDADGLAFPQGGADPIDGGGVAVGTGEQFGERPARDLGQTRAGEAGITFVDPLDTAMRVGDDDGIVGPARNEGELAGLGLAGAQGLVGALAGVDVLDGAEDPQRAVVRAEGDAFGAQGDPEPFPAVVQHAVLDFNERGFIAKVRRDDRPHGGLIVSVEQIQPALAGGGHLRGVIADHLPDAGSEIDLVGFDVPFINTHLGGIEGEIEAFVGGLEPGLDAAALLVFREQLRRGVLGTELAAAGGLRQIDDETEQDTHAQAGEKRDLGQELAVGIQKDRARGQGDRDPLVEEKVVGGQAQALVDGLLGGHGLKDFDFTVRTAGGSGIMDRDDELVAVRKIEPAVDAIEQFVVIKLADHETAGVGAAHGEINGKSGGLQRGFKRGGDGEGEGLARGFCRRPPLRLARMVEGRGVLIAFVRPEPAGVQAGVNPLDGAVAAEVPHGFGRIIFPHQLRVAGGFLPAGGQARKIADVVFTFTAEERRDIVDRELGGAADIAQFALPQCHPERAGHREAANHHGQPQPARAGVRPDGIIARRQHNEGGPQQDYHHGGVRAEPGIGLPELQGIQAGLVGQQTGEPVGGAHRTNHSQQDIPPGHEHPGGEPGQFQAGEQKDRGQRRRHPADVLPGNEVFMTHQQVVEPEIQIRGALGERGSRQQRGEKSEGKTRAPPAQREGDGKKSDQDCTDTGIGRQGRVIGTGLHQSQIARHPAEQHREAEDRQHCKRSEIAVLQKAGAVAVHEKGEAETTLVDKPRLLHGNAHLGTFT